MTTREFPTDYFAARDRFRSLAQQAGWKQNQHTIAATGPQGEALTIDTAIWEPDTAQRTVIISSALHGVEGFLGSALQCAALEQWTAAAPPPDVRIVLVHALNPYGYAHLRRWNEDGVDLNRNFLREDEAYQGSPQAYPQFNGLLNPTSPPSRWEPFRLRSLWAIWRFGLPQLKQAIATGQYDFPEGLFFGGHGPGETTRYIREQLANWAGTTRDVLHLDIHTGLGPPGELQLLLDGPITPDRRQWIEQRLSEPIVVADAEESVAYACRGSIGGDLTSRLPQHNYTYLCAEFGTHDPVTVLKALRAENRAHQWGRPESASTRWAKGLLVEAFCPRSAHWRAQVFDRGLSVITAAVRSAAIAK
ncbi:DUF2817 domain-containing protein [bacterium]|nr:DUF2817 domain-containing protein [bacterium]